MRGAGRVVFAGILLLFAGTINIIYGIGALDDANIFVNDTRLVQNTTTPGNGDEPGFAFTIMSNGTVRQ